MVQNVVSTGGDLSATTPILSMPGNVTSPTIPSASNTLEEPTSPRRNLHMVKAHPPSQMLRSTTDGVRTRSSCNTLLANHAFVSLLEQKNIKEVLLDPD